MLPEGVAARSAEVCGRGAGGLERGLGTCGDTGGYENEGGFRMPAGWVAELMMEGSGGRGSGCIRGKLGARESSSRY